MKFGLEINEFNWSGGPAEMGRHLADVGRQAEDAGFHSIWVWDHFIQLRRWEEPLLEGWLMLAYLAAATERVMLGTLVTGVTYRHPAILVKQATTLDVLSGGRSYFGVGAAWNEREHGAFGVRFPPIAERFEWLEDTLRMAHEMWSGGSGTGGPFEGKRVLATHLVNSPQSISRPRVPILVGGGGERKTLRLVAQYADACNVFGRSPEFVRDKLAVLRAHCDRLGRPYDEIERTILTSIDLESDSTDATVQRFGELGEAGAQHLIFSVRGVADISKLEHIGSEILPQLR